GLVLWITADHQVGAPGQRPAQRDPGVAAHDNRMPQGDALEVRQVGRQAPGQGVVAANDAVFGVGDDELYDGWHDGRIELCFRPSGDAAKDAGKNVREL